MSKRPWSERLPEFPNWAVRVVEIETEALEARIKGLEAEKASCVRQMHGLLELVAEYEARINEAKEVYIGMEGFIPETAPEAYQKRILDQMYDTLREQGE
jgi:hypothetical protein